MFILYRNDRKNQFPWQFEEISRDDDFLNLVDALMRFTGLAHEMDKALRLEIDWTQEFAELYTEEYIYVIQ